MPVVLTTPGDAPLLQLPFEPRPLGSSSSPQAFRVWNNKPETYTDEAVGTGDGTTAAFVLANKPVIAGECAVRVDGVLQTSPGDYTLLPETGTLLFAAGSIPASGMAVTATYKAAASNAIDHVYLVLACFQEFDGNGAQKDFLLSKAATAVYAVEVDGELQSREDWTFLGGQMVRFPVAPAAGAVVRVQFEDEALQKQTVRMLSSGVTAPLGGAVVDDDQKAYTSLGGHEELAGQALGTGNGTSTNFLAPHTCLVPGTLTVSRDGVPVDPGEYSWNEIDGSVEFHEAPAAGAVMTANYWRYKALRLGAMPPWTARTILARSKTPTSAKFERYQATLRCISM